MRFRTWLELACGIACVLSVVLLPPIARAADVPQSFTLDGKLFTDAAATTALQDASVTFTVQILDEAKTCVIYEET